MHRFGFFWKVAIVLVAAITVTDGSVAARKASTRRNSVGMEFVQVPAGEFRMGSTSEDAGENEMPLTAVTISRAFYIGKHEVTQKQWVKVMGTNPSDFNDCPDCPVEQVSWNDAQAFIRTLNAMEDSKRYRLPTEAEWEYAARGGTGGDRYSADLNAIAWYDKNCNERPHKVGEKAPNAYGLFDMLGNVYEWVQDWKGPYAGGKATDPKGPARGKFRMIRGGSWETGAKSCRAPHRLDASPGFRIHAVGLRILMENR